MKNREYLLQTNPADILKEANDRIIGKKCSCVLETMCDDVDYYRCVIGDCNKCIELWLNEERRQT